MISMILYHYMEITNWLHLLENNPEEYLSKLEIIYLEDIDKANEIVNTISFDIWYGNHSHAIGHLVGSLITNNKDVFYGCKCPYFDEVLGIKLIKLMYLCNVDLSLPDYYGLTPLNSILESKKGSITHRNNNEHFIRVLENLTHHSP